MEIAELYNLYKNHPNICTDTRKIEKGSIFFALKGKKFNGNYFAAKAISKGCDFAIIDEKKFRANDKYILVNNVLETLQNLAKHHREQIDIPILGITGSNGKTTSKELIYSVLNKELNCYATKGNLNNHIGVPLSILESAVSNGWNGVVIDIADNQKLKSQSNWKIYDFKIGNIGKIFKKLHLEKITHIVLCGGISRPKLYEMKFDFKGLNIMSKIAFKGDDGALKILSEEIENEGFNIISANHFLEKSFSPKGHFAGPKPFSTFQKEIKRGYGVLKSLSKSDVGQSVVIQNGLILAVEAIEGTDEMIKRAGKLKFSGLGPILVKAPKINQDMRFDQPVIGEKTIDYAYKSGFSGIACKHKNVLIINLEKVIKLAEKRQITLFGF